MTRARLVAAGLLAFYAATATATADTKPTIAALDALLARTEAIAKEVSRVRGLPLKRAIPNDVVDREELRKRLIAMADEDKAKRETAAEGLALARWGMIPLTIDYRALVIDLLTEQIAGYYDPDTKKLTISQSAGDDADWAELVLAHEIEHGLQDQSYDLKKFEDVLPSEGDSALARRALVEGDGIALMFEWMLGRRKLKVPWASPELAATVEKSMSVPSGSLERAPIAIRESLIFPYRSGFTFVAALRRRQPWSAVDAAFKKPPRSTEQILHPERYLAGDQPVSVALDVPPVLRGYTIVHTTVWGELVYSLFLRSHGLDPALSATAADGWGGDRAIVVARPGETRPERAIAIARSEWDSEVDAIEAQEAAVKAVDAAVAGAQIERSSVRSQWLAVDGTVSWVERRGPSMVIVHGAPAWAAGALVNEVWSASRVQANK